MTRKRELESLATAGSASSTSPRGAGTPTIPEWRWMVAGTAPINLALSLARGDFITHLDDSDEHPEDRIAKLVSFIRESKADFVWHPF